MALNIVFILQSHFYTKAWSSTSEIYTKFEAPYATLQGAQKAAGDDSTPAEDWQPIGEGFWRSAVQDTRWWSIERREIR